MSRAVLLVVFVLAACKGGEDRSRPAPVSTDRTAGLAERVRDQIKAAYPAAVVTIPDPKTVHVKRGEIEVTLSLDNMESSCRSSAAECDDAMTAAVKNLAITDTEHMVTPENLVITVKTQQWFDDTDKMLREKVADKYEMNKLVASALAGDLVAVLGADHPSGITMVSAEQLSKLKLDPKAAFDRARKNLAATHAELKLTIMEGTPVYTNDEDDNYITATIALPELYKPFAAKVKGDLLVGFPSRNRIFLTGSKEPGAVEGIAKIANVAFQTEDHPISPTIFKWSPTGWTVHALR